MSEKKIFISYRRDDVPGYVARLEDDLERVFGQYSVFRDVEDIAGGTEWKRAIEHNLKASSALVLIIGPHWSRLWKERQNDPVNYVAWELQRAHELGLAIIPVTMHGGALQPDLDLGDISWLHEKQLYDISDRQGRWKFDLQGLIALLERLPGLNRQSNNKRPYNQKTDKRSKSWLWATAASAVLILALSALVPGFLAQPDQKTLKPGTVKNNPGTDVLIATEENNPTKQAEIAAVEPKEPVSSSSASVTVTVSRNSSSNQTNNAGIKVNSTNDIPDISGTWISQHDGTLYLVDQLADGRFTINSPGYASGEGEFIKNMPRKFRVTMPGIGHGEYSLSNSDDSIMGWFLENETGSKVYEKMTRIQ